MFKKSVIFYVVVVLAWDSGFVSGNGGTNAILNKLNELQQMLMSQTTTTAAPTSVSAALTEIDLLQRLEELEGRVESIKNYLVGEKKLDVQLRKKSEEVIDEMKSKVSETDVVINSLRTDVENSLNVFDGKINAVNRTAHVKINAQGAVLYGGIGSSCSTNGGECVTKDGECRDGKCQCVPGYSYDLGLRTCASSCETYGFTFQSVKRRIIRDYNDLTLEDVELDDCTKACIEETTFVCRSFDYFPRWNACYLSENVKTDVPDENWEYNTEGYHFQRDCL